MTYRVAPRVWIGVAVVVGYVVVVQLVQRLSGVPFPEFGASGRNLFFGAGLSLIVGAVLLAITTSALGWWQPVVHDRHRAVHRWPVIAPALIALLAVLNLVGTDWGAYDLAFFGASLVLLLVGFTEEMATRGLLVTALRTRFGEIGVWFFSSLAFGLIHYSNVLAGQSLAATNFQVLSAFLFGTALYVLRRVTGTLLWCMILHALWDFSVFAVKKGTPASFANLGLADIVVGVFAVVAVFWVVRGADERIYPLPSRRPRPQAEPLE